MITCMADWRTDGLLIDLLNGLYAQWFDENRSDLLYGAELLIIVVCCPLQGLVACETDVNDFDHNYLGYEFIFHDTRVS